MKTSLTKMWIELCPIRATVYNNLHMAVMCEEAQQLDGVPSFLDEALSYNINKDEFIKILTEAITKSSRNKSPLLIKELRKQHVDI